MMASSRTDSKGLYDQTVIINTNASVRNRHSICRVVNWSLEPRSEISVEFILVSRFFWESLTFPHVKHLTGMIMTTPQLAFNSEIRLCGLSFSLTAYIYSLVCDTQQAVFIERESVFYCSTVELQGLFSSVHTRLKLISGWCRQTLGSKEHLGPAMKAYRC